MQRMIRYLVSCQAIFFYTPYFPVANLLLTFFVEQWSVSSFADSYFSFCQLFCRAAFDSVSGFFCFAVSRPAFHLPQSIADGAEVSTDYVNFAKYLTPTPPFYRQAHGQSIPAPLCGQPVPLFCLFPDTCLYPACCLFCILTIFVNI